MMSNEQLFRDIQLMIELCCDTKGVDTKTRQQFRKKHPEIEFSESIIRNTIIRIRSDSKSAQKFVNTLETMKENLQVEFLHLFLHPITNILEDAVWSYAEARNVMSRCDDLLFWDSTHNSTKFLYGLA